LTKYISLNKINIDLSGTKEKILIVRDMTPLVDMKKNVLTQ